MNSKNRTKKSILFNILTILTAIIIGCTATSIAFAAWGGSVSRDGSITIARFTDDLDPYIPFRMEAENAEFTFASDTVVYTDYYHLGFDLRFSGSLSTRNMSATGNITEFKFVSDKTVRNVDMDILIGGWPDNNTLTLESIFDISANGDAVDTAGITVYADDCELLGHNKYMIYKQVTVKVDLQEGNNTITFYSLRSTGGNLDYIELNTSAIITGWDSTHYSDTASMWEVTKEPTFAATGTVLVTSPVKEDGTVGSYTQSYTLPVLSEDNGYNAETDGTVVSYSFGLKGVTYSYSYDTAEKYMVTLKENSGVTFEGGALSAELSVGDTLPQIIDDTERGVGGWYNVDDESETWTADGFRMLDKNIAIAPYFAPVGDSLTFGTTIDSKSNGGNGERTAANVFINGEMNGAIFTFTSTTAGSTSTSGSRVRIRASSQVYLNTSYTFWYSFENKGEVPISFYAHQITNSTNIVTGANTGLIALNPGDAKRVSITVTFTSGDNPNSNALLLFYFQSIFADAKLGIAVSKVTN